MVIFLVAIILAFLQSSKTALAQIPIQFQLLYSYQPGYHYSPINTFTTPTPTPTAQVLGVSITNPDTVHIGGEGQVISLAVIGDSMIETLGQNIPSLSAALQKYYPAIKFNISNFGRGATTLTYAKNRLPIIFTQKPDLIVLESFAYNNYGNTAPGYDQYQQELESIIATIHQQLPNTKIILAATIAPDTVHFAKGVKDLNLSSLDRLERTNTIKLYLEKLIRFATTNNLPLADAYTPSLVNDSGNPRFINITDYIHPSPAGANFFSQILAKTIFDHHLL